MPITDDPGPPPADRRGDLDLRGPGIVLGVGLGGFFDGIVFHQILQLHHMLTNTGQDNLGLEPVPADTVDGLEANTVWDGLFHASTYLLVIGGLVWLWHRWRRVPAATPSWTLLIGSLLTGWGLFNLVEGVVNHHILAIHHVAAGDLQVLWDVAFLAAGALLVGGGWALTRAALRKTPRQRTGSVNGSGRSDGGYAPPRRGGEQPWTPRPPGH